MAKDWTNIRTGVLEKIKPTDSSIIKLAEAVMNVVREQLAKEKVSAEVIPGGSLAKNTYLKDDFDVDIFVAFDKQYKKNDLSTILAKVLRPLKPELVHGSRDYFHLKQKGIQFEIVPVLQIRSPDEALNVTDMSPHHVNWVRTYLKKKPIVGDDIRLAKQFCKAQGVYGAESYIGGFSGHVLDILVIHYGSFENLLRESSAWISGTVVDSANVHKGHAHDTLNKAKLESPLIVIDPIMPERNAAAALCVEKFELFKKQAKKFLKKPAKEYFEIRPFSLEALRHTYEQQVFLSVDVVPLKGKLDIVGAKLRKVFEHLQHALVRYDFTLVDSGWHWDKQKLAVFWFAVQEKKLNATKVVIGPPSSHKLHTKAFKKKHAIVKEKQGRLSAVEKRIYQTPGSALKAAVNGVYVRSRVSSVKVDIK